MKTIHFTKHHGLYMSGEKAGFKDEEADAHVAAGRAVHVDKETGKPIFPTEAATEDAPDEAADAQQKAARKSRAR